MTSPFDLTTVAFARSWIGGLGSAQVSPQTNNNIQACITAASIEFLRLTGRGPINWQNASASPFVQPVDYVELYSGNGNPEMFLRNFPVNSIASLLILGTSVPASTSPATAGYEVGATGRSIVLIVGGGTSVDTFQNFYPYGGGIGRRYGFPYGVQNVQVSYNAGFNAQTVASELQTVLEAWEPTTAYVTGDLVSGGGFVQQAANSGTSGASQPPWAAQTTQDGSGSTTINWNNTGIVGASNTITAALIYDGYSWLTDGGVKYFSSGIPLTPVLVSPAVGEYFIVSPGVYLFNAADTGVEMILSYTAAGTPADIVLAIAQWVALNYARRNWVGIRSIAMKDVGSTTYTMVAFDEAVKKVIANYTRKSV